MGTCKKDEWEAAIDSGKFYFTVNSNLKRELFKMERKPDGLYYCCPVNKPTHYYTWDVRKIRRACKNWTLVYSSHTQEKTNVNDNDLYQKISAKQKQLRGLTNKRAELQAQAGEVLVLIVKEARQLAELKHELLSALKKELGS